MTPLGSSCRPIRVRCSGPSYRSMRDVTPGYTFWNVVKFIPGHTCSLDIYDSHFQSVKAIVIGSLFLQRVAISEYTPGMLMEKLLEQHGVQIMYTKAWRSLQHVKRFTYSNVD